MNSLIFFQTFVVQAFLMPKNAVKKSANFLFSLTSSLEIFFSQIKESINPQKMFLLR